MATPHPPTGQTSSFFRPLRNGLLTVLIAALSFAIFGCRNKTKAPPEAELERGEGVVEKEQVYEPSSPSSEEGTSESTGTEGTRAEGADGDGAAAENNGDQETARSEAEESATYPVENLETRYTKDIQGNGPLYAIMETSLGKISCRLFEKEVPRTVDNFVGLARGLKPWRDPESGDTVTRPLYNGLIFHRVVPDLLIQSGDPTGSGMGDPGFFILDEFHDDLRHDEPGTLSMAQSRPDGNGSQFFITVGEAPQFDGRYPVFGRCDSLDVIEEISRADVGESRVQRPVEPIVLKKVGFERR